MFVRHRPAWPASAGAQGICAHKYPDGSQCNIDLFAGSGGGVDALHVWENTHLLIPSQGTRYLVTHREYVQKTSWPYSPPRQTLGTFYDDDIVLSEDVIYLSVNNRPTIIRKTDILAITDKVPDHFDWLAREVEPPRCLEKVYVEDQLLPAKCRLVQVGHGDWHCAASVTGDLTWWRGSFRGPVVAAPPTQRRRGIWDRLLGR